MLEHAVRTQPSSIPVLEAYCRFLNATNEFAESLVVGTRTLAFDPWKGMALFHIGVAHLELGRTDEEKAALVQALKLRPGSTVRNIAIPTKNARPAYIEARNRIDQALIEAGLPER